MGAPQTDVGYAPCFFQNAWPAGGVGKLCGIVLRVSQPFRHGGFAQAVDDGMAAGQGQALFDQVQAPMD